MIAETANRSGFRFCLAKNRKHIEPTFRKDSREKEAPGQVAEENCGSTVCEVGQK